MIRLDTKGIIALAAAVLIMLSFFVVKTLVMIGWVEYIPAVEWFEYLSVIGFMPPFFYVLYQVIQHQRLETIKKKTLQSILDESCLVSQTDQKGKIIDVNEKFCDVSGYKKQELLGKDHNILNSGKHSREVWRDMYTVTLQYKAIWHEIVTNKNKAGELYIVDTYIMATFDETGKHTGFLSVRQDITELVNSLNLVDKKSKEIENVISAIDKSNATIEFTPHGNIITANKNFTDIMEYDLEEIQGEHHSIFVDEYTKNSRKYQVFWKSLRDGQFKTGEFVRYTKSGKEVFIQGTYNPILENGKLVKVLKIVTDITNSVLQKQEIERKNAYLEHAAKILRHDMHSGINTYIPRGATSLERRLEKIQQSIDPDTIYKEWKQLEAPMKLLKEGIHHAQRVYSGVKEFTNLVKQDAVMDTSPYILSDILDKHLRGTAYRGQVQIQDLGTEDVNESLFCTAIDNLIRNGLRYNDNDTKYIKLYKEDTDIIVEDNGRGITQKEFEELSKPYTRKTGQKESGSGLGLNICVAIMREHGFTVTCEKIETGTKIKIKVV